MLEFDQSPTPVTPTMTCANPYYMDDQADKMEQILDLSHQGRKSEARALAAEINLTAARRGWEDPEHQGRNYIQHFCDCFAESMKIVTGDSIA